MKITAAAREYAAEQSIGGEKVLRYVLAIFESNRSTIVDLRE